MAIDTVQSKSEYIPTGTDPYLYSRYQASRSWFLGDSIQFTVPPPPPPHQGEKASRPRDAFVALLNVISTLKTSSQSSERPR